MEDIIIPIIKNYEISNKWKNSDSISDLLNLQVYILIFVLFFLTIPFFFSMVSWMKKDIKVQIFYYFYAPVIQLYKERICEML